MCRNSVQVRNHLFCRNGSRRSECPAHNMHPCNPTGQCGYLLGAAFPRIYGARDECHGSRATRDPKSAGNFWMRRQPPRIVCERQWKRLFLPIPRFLQSRVRRRSYGKKHSHCHYCGKPILRARSVYRGSERRESNVKSVRRAFSPSCSSYAVLSHSKAILVAQLGI